MLGISQQLHDTIFAVGALVLLIALLPAVVKKTIMPLSTIWVTGAVLAVFAFNYLTMHYWYAMAVEAGNVLAWTYLFTLSWKVRYDRKQEAA